MPGSMGFTCTDEKTTAVLACSEQPDRLYKEVSVNPEGKLTDREGNVLPCTVATQNGAERSLRDGITVKKGALTPIGW